MANRRVKSLFITFEGPEKSGKSTQAKLLKEYLLESGQKCLFIREPGSTKLSEKIRDILLDKKNTNITPFTEMFLYMTARAQLVEEVIEPALKSGKIVICDRYHDSTIAYQGYGLGLDIKIINKIGEFVTKCITPDITILLDMSDETRPTQKGYVKDRIELRSRRYHNKVRQGYFRLAKQEPKRIKIVKVKDDVFATQRKIREIIAKCLLKK